MEKTTKKRYGNYISVRVEDTLFAFIERLAREEDRPVGMMARLLLREAATAREQGRTEKKKK